MICKISVSIASLHRKEGKALEKKIICSYREAITNIIEKHTNIHFHKLNLCMFLLQPIFE